MAFFAKNPNEVAFLGGKKHFTDVIKNTAPDEVMIWRQPEEDFNTNSTLIVMPGEEAIFIKSGKVEQVFENGTYRLSTKNYPFISRLINAVSGGISRFNCVVYFVRKAHSEEILWGTESPIQVRDKLLGIATKVKARGSYKVQIEDPNKFLSKLIGSNISCQTQKELNKYFINEFQSKIKSVIARGINESDTEVLGIDARLDEFSDKIQPFMQDILGGYGLKCVKFTVSGLDIDDDELRRRYDEQGMDSLAKVRNAQADKAVFGILGEDWDRQRDANILANLSNNSGISGFATAGAGIGMGMAAGGILNNIAQQMCNPVQQTVSADVGDSIESLQKLKTMLDNGLIPQEVYTAKMNEILSRM